MIKATMKRSRRQTNSNVHEHKCTLIIPYKYRRYIRCSHLRVAASLAADARKQPTRPQCKQKAFTVLNTVLNCDYNIM